MLAAQRKRKKKPLDKPAAELARRIKLDLSAPEEPEQPRASKGFGKARPVHPHTASGQQQQDDDESSVEDRAATRAFRAHWSSLPLFRRRQRLADAFSPVDALNMVITDAELFDADTTLQCVSRLRAELPASEHKTAVEPEVACLLFNRIQHWKTGSSHAAQRALMELVDGRQAALAADWFLWDILSKALTSMEQLPQRMWELQWLLRSIDSMAVGDKQGQLLKVLWDRLGCQLKHAEVEHIVQVLQTCKGRVVDDLFTPRAAQMIAEGSPRASVQVQLVLGSPSGLFHGLTQACAGTGWQPAAAAEPAVRAATAPCADACRALLQRGGLCGLCSADEPPVEGDGAAVLGLPASRAPIDYSRSS